MNSTAGVDLSDQCIHHNEQGRCTSPAIRGETRCVAHSGSEVATSIRERMVVQGVRAELDRFREGGITYNPPVAPRVFSSGSSARWTDARPGSGKYSFARGESKPEQGQEEVYKMLFRGDITTGEGLIRLTERLIREFAAGKLDSRRFEKLMRGVRLLAALRRQFPAPPIDEPAEQRAAPPSAESLVVEADRRPSTERAEELKASKARPSSGRQASREGSVSAEPEPSMRPPEAPPVGDYKEKRSAETSRQRRLSASGGAKSRKARTGAPRRLKFPPPHRSKKRDGD